MSRSPGRHSGAGVGLWGSPASDMTGSHQSVSSEGTSLVGGRVAQPLLATVRREMGREKGDPPPLHANPCFAFPIGALSNWGFGKRGKVALRRREKFTFPRAGQSHGETAASSEWILFHGGRLDIFRACAEYASRGWVRKACRPFRGTAASLWLDSWT